MDEDGDDHNNSASQNCQCAGSTIDRNEEYGRKWKDSINSSTENLLVECASQLYIGHWELFRAVCTTIINQADSVENKSFVLNILKKLYDQPELLCKDPKLLADPRIFWLCAKFYAEICDDKDEAAVLLSDAGYRNVLWEVYEEKTKDQVKELHNTFLLLLKGYEIKLPIFTPGTKKFLINLLHLKPKVGIEVLEPLLQKSKCSDILPELLSCLYESLEHCLTKLDLACGSAFNSEIDEIASAVTESVYIQLTLCEYFGEFYSKDLSNSNKKCYDVEVYHQRQCSNLKLDVDQLLQCIWHLCEKGVLDKTSIYFSLLSHRDPWMIKRLCYLEDRAMNRLRLENANLSAENYLRLVYNHRTGQLNIKELFLYSFINKHHFLECLTSSSVELLSSGEHLLVSGVLRDAVLCRLKPLIMLLLWARVKTIPEVAKYIDAYEILYSFDMPANTHLNLACKRLVNKAKLVLWALNNVCNEKKLANDRDAAEFLTSLPNHSALYILHYCADLDQGNREQISDILKDGRFGIEHTNNAEIQCQSFAELMHVEQLRDQMILHSYYIMYDFVHIIHAGMKFDQLIAEGRCILKKAEKEGVAITRDGVDDNQKFEILKKLEQFYADSVFEPLKMLIEKLDGLFPLTYRVEILENIFSLLFLTHQNLTESSIESSPDSSDEGYERTEDIHTNKHAAANDLQDDEIVISESISQYYNRKKSSFCQAKHLKDGGSPKHRLRKAKWKLGTRETCHSSENTSSFSGSSAIGPLPRVGFLMSKFVVRDTLEFLHHCVINTSAVCSAKDNSTINHLTDTVASSINEKNLSRRISTLLCHITEAQWRFQLVADDWIPKEFGVFPLESLIEQQHLCKNWSYQFYKDRTSDDEGNLGFLANSGNVTEGDIKESPIEQQKKIVPTRRKSSCSSLQLKKYFPFRGIISKMLASHESLLITCMQQNELTKAQHIIKIFGMEHTLMAKEVEFAQDYEKTVYQLSLSIHNKLSRLQSQRGVRSCASAWESIVEAAQSGMDAASAEMLVADELLASHKVPGIAEIDEFECKGQLVTWLPEQIDWRALVRTDLALAACDKIHACRSLLESSYVSLRGNPASVSPIRASRTRTANMRGILGLIEDVVALISPELRATVDSKGMMDSHMSEIQGVRELLLQSSFPLTAKAYRKMKTTWERICRELGKLHELLESESACTGGKEEQCFRPQSSSPNPLNVQDQLSSGHPIHALYRKLMKHVSTLKISVEEEISIRSINALAPPVELLKDARYLATLYDYAKNLSALLSQYHIEPLIVGGNYFTTLLQSPTSILERLLFTNAVPPLELEEFSKQLNLNLMEIIIRHYCPFIPATGYFSEIDKCSGENKLDSSEQLAFVPEDTLRKQLSVTALDRLASSSSTITKDLFVYIEKKCWVVAIIMRALGCVTENDGGSESDSYHGDSEILHPVLHRFLERRCSSNTAPLQPSIVLCPAVSLARIKSVLNGFTSNERWHEALNYLNSWECHSAEFQEDICCYRNLVLSKLVVLSLDDEDQAWKYVLQMSDNSKVEIILKHYLHWSADGVMASLQDCCSDSSLDTQTREKLLQLKEQVRLFQTILRKVVNEGLKLEVGDDHPVLIVWQDVAKMVHDSVCSLTKNLFKLREYSIILQMNDLHLLPSDMQEVVDDCSVLSLLEEFEINPTTVLKALSRSETPQQRLAVCQKVLEFISKVPSDVSVLLHLLETADLSGISDSELQQYLYQKVGVKILFCLPSEEREDYIDLITRPNVMIEQLLINIKIEALQAAFHMIRTDLRSFNSDSKLSFVSINHTLEYYASKAVDFRVIPVVFSGRFQNPVQSATVLVEKRLPFVMPLQVPPKQKWVPDTSVLECMVCSVEIFSMFNRRHHCRRCGRVVCATCSQKRKRVKGYGDVPVRICDECHEQGASLATSNSGDALETRVKAHLTTSGSTETCSKTSVALPVATSDVIPENMKKVIWKMSLDPSHNVTTREEFSYEEAPSISLCLSICDLHWDQHRSGQYLLTLAHTLFKYLQPISPGVPNPEIDYSLVINMLKSVLLSAKVKFSKTFDNDAVSRCDLMLGLADVCKLLVSSNCKHLIPPVDRINNDVIRELRDHLMREERWNLSLEISTKGGLDVIGVWAAWGMICLRMGYYSMAREKFSHCLERIKDKNKVAQSNPLLEQILKQLESSCSVYDVKENAVTTSLAKLKDIKKGAIQKTISLDFARPKLHSKIREECIYYIETYGSHASNLSFYVKHNEWENALRYSHEKKCPALTFIEEVIMASLHKGRFSEVKFTMQRLDPSLMKWESFLDPLCRYFQRSNLFHVLYEWQKFLKDDIRCAMTCMHFYQQGARDYNDLNGRLPHLQQATKHLEDYKLRYDACATFSKKITLHLPTKDVDRYLNAITLQTEVTIFVNERLFAWQSLFHIVAATSCNTSSTSLSSMSQPISLECNSDAPKTGIPTVFGNSTERAHVALMVILCCKQLSEGFDLAARILKEFHLHPVNVYYLIAKHLIQLQRLAEIPLFLNCMKRVGGQDNEICDQVLLKAIRLSQNVDETKGTELLIKLLSYDKNKIDAFILCGKLKSAYLLAVKDNNVDAVNRLCIEAERTGQIMVKTICEKWLNLRH